MAKLQCRWYITVEIDHQPRTFESVQDILAFASSVKAENEKGYLLSDLLPEIAREIIDSTQLDKE